ncbi:MAG: DNA helicase [Buchananella hordeovulneris]|nr:DNA helicase [Buchananella hordeovulneris]
MSPFSFFRKSSGDGTELPAADSPVEQPGALPDGQILAASPDAAAAGSAGAGAGAEHEDAAEGNAASGIRSEEDYRRAIETRLIQWSTKLVTETDLGGEELILDLAHAHPSGHAQLFAGRPTRLANLLREPAALAEGQRTVRAIRRAMSKARANNVVAPLHLAIGEATWLEPAEALGAGGADGEQQRGHAPLLLCPVKLTGATDDSVTFTVDTALQVAPAFVRAVRARGIHVDTGALVTACLTRRGFSPQAALDFLQRLGSEALPGFEKQDTLRLGLVVQPEEDLLTAFQEALPDLRSCALVAGLVGDPGAISVLKTELPEPQATDRDPFSERGAGDMDPDQLNVIDAVVAGNNLVVDAPAGSELAGTVSAVMADAAATGRVSVFVPGSRRTASALAHAVSDLGLEGLFADATREDGWQANLAAALRASLSRDSIEVNDDEIADVRERLVNARRDLSNYIAALYRHRPEWDASMHKVLGELSGLTYGRPCPRTKVQFSSAQLEAITQAGRPAAHDLLRRADEAGLIASQPHSTPWFGARPESPEHALSVVESVVRLHGEPGTEAVDYPGQTPLEQAGLLETLRVDAHDVAEETGLVEAETVNQWIEQLEMLDGVRDSLDVFLPTIFERSAADMVIATATKEWRREHSFDMSGRDRRRLAKQAKSLVRPGRTVDDLHAELIKVQQRREIWRRYAAQGGWPVLPTGLPELRSHAELVRSELERVDAVVAKPGGVALGDVHFEPLARLLAALASPAYSNDLPIHTQLNIELEQMGMVELVADLRARRVEGDMLLKEFELAWWVSVLQHILTADSHLQNLDGQALSQLSYSVRVLDKQHVETLAGPLLRAAVARVREEVDRDYEGAAQLSYCLAPEHAGQLTQTLVDFPLARRLLPMWSVPALLAPALLPQDAPIDLLIVEANVPIERVISLAARANQLVVVGELHRPGGIGAEVADLLPRLALPTDRGDRDGEIAALLASYGHGGLVRPVPAPRRTSRMRVVHLEGRGTPNPGAENIQSVDVEVAVVVEQVREHAFLCPEQSLAVVALNAFHAARITEAVHRAAQESAELASFIYADAAEGFLVKAVEDVAGLRRDHVILAVGFAKTQSNRVLHRFGTLATPEGLTGLVDSLDAVRSRLTVVSCLRGEELDPHRLLAPGPRLLRDVLLAAEGKLHPTPPSGQDAAGGAEPENASPAEAGEAAGAAEAEAGPDPLLVDLAERLFRKGLVVTPNYGTPGGIRIPLALGHPDLPDEYVVALLTDNADYVAEPSQRRRDRHWVERLEDRGWVVHTASSAAIFLDPQWQADHLENLVVEVVRSRMIELKREEEVELDVPAEPDSVPAEPEPGQESAPAQALQGKPRRIRPPTATGLPLAAYGDDQLDDLLAWIESDGLERTHEELVEELRKELGLVRRGAQSDAVLGHVVRRAHPS